MNIRSFRPESPEQIAPLLIPTERFPWYGERRWVTPDMGPDMYHTTAYSRPVHVRLTRRVRGIERKLSGMSVHSIQDVSDGSERRFHYIVIDGRDGVGKDERTTGNRVYVPVEDDADTKRIVIARTIFSYLNEVKYANEDVTEEAIGLAAAVQEKRRAESDALAQGLDEFLGNLMQNWGDVQERKRALGNSLE